MNQQEEFIKFMSSQQRSINTAISKSTLLKPSTKIKGRGDEISLLNNINTKGNYKKQFDLIANDLLIKFETDKSYNFNE